MHFAKNIIKIKNDYASIQVQIKPKNAGMQNKNAHKLPADLYHHVKNKKGYYAVLL